MSKRVLDGQRAASLAEALSDDELVANARRDLRAFAPLYERYREHLYRYCYRRLRNRQAAEDITSTVFLRAIDRLALYRGGSFRAWLFTIAHHAIVDAGRMIRPTTGADALERVRDVSQDPVSATLLAESRLTVHQLLDTLPVDQRRVLELHLAGLSGPEIAAVFGRSHGAIRAIQTRALRRLREIARPGFEEQVQDG